MHAHDVPRVITVIAVVCLLLQFVLSGFFKLRDTRECADAKIMEKAEIFGLKPFRDRACALNMMVLIAAAVWELGAAAVAMLTTLSDSYPTARRLAFWSLALFTVLATLLFKTRKYYGLVSNVSVFGGLVIAGLTV